jgi:hypothetical protein
MVMVSVHFKEHSETCHIKLQVAFIYFSGAVKITPAHDPNDYDIGKRHNLPFITIFSDDGNVIGDYGIFSVSKLFSFLNSNRNPKLL